MARREGRRLRRADVLVGPGAHGLPSQASLRRRSTSPAEVARRAEGVQAEQAPEQLATTHLAGRATLDVDLRRGDQRKRCGDDPRDPEPPRGREVFELPDQLRHGHILRLTTTAPKSVARAISRRVRQTAPTVPLSTTSTGSRSVPGRAGRRRTGSTRPVCRASIRRSVWRAPSLCATAAAPILWMK